MDSRAPRDGRVIEELGTYDPVVPETDARAILNAERIDYWMSVGAKPTPKVGVLIKKYGKDGTHLDAQKEAIERLGGRRQKNIAEAIAAANNLPTAPEPEAAAPAPAEGEAAAEAPATEEAATEAPAEEAAAEATDAPAEEAPKE
jgi:small subunit ribosomal protein S16